MEGNIFRDINQKEFFFYKITIVIESAIVTILKFVDIEYLLGKLL